MLLTKASFSNPHLQDKPAAHFFVNLKLGIKINKRMLSHQDVTFFKIIE
jgi:hypothetical protein